MKDQTPLQKTFAEIIDMAPTEIADLVLELREKIATLEGGAAPLAVSLTEPDNVDEIWKQVGICVICADSEKEATKSLMREYFICERSRLTDKQEKV